MFLPIITIIISLAILGIAAHHLVESAVHIAKKLKMSDILIGLTIVAVGTSAPEIAVSVMAAIHGNGSLSVGNIVGSNIFNVGFILGIIALISVQKINHKLVYRDGLVLLFSTILILIVAWDHHVSFIEGTCMLLLLIAYNIVLFVKKEVPEFEAELEVLYTRKHWYDIIIFVSSLIILVISSNFVVDSAVVIAQSFGMTEWSIGVTIIAIGTSLPEIATSVAATYKKRFDLAVGNLIGSDIFNALGIIGVSAVIAPLSLNSSTNTIFGLRDNIVSIIIQALTLIVTLILMRSGWKIGKQEGTILVSMSILRIIFEGYVGMQ